MNQYTSNGESKNNSIEAKTVASELAQAFDALEVRDFKLVIDIAKSLLSKDKTLAQAHYLIGRVTLETRQIDIALKALESAVNFDPAKSEYWAFLALVYSQTGNMLKADKAVKSAQQIGSDQPYVLHPMAHVLSLLGYVQEATKLLQKAVRQAPNVGVYQHALGVSLLELGDYKAAKRAFEQAVSINEYDAESWWLLSSLVKAKNNDMAEKLLSLTKNPRLPARPKAYFGYAAGKWFEDTQSWEQAFKAFKYGADAKRSSLNYDSATALKTFEALARICTKEWLQTAQNETGEVCPIFIVGQPRTGTTLVDRIISSHSLVHSAGEPVQLAMSLRAITGVRTEAFISEELVEKSQQVEGKDLATSYLTGLGNSRGSTPFFIDKFPMNFMLIGLIVKAFPNAKIIHVTRGAEDTCFAVFKQLFEDVYQHSYDQQEMAEHYVMYRNLMSHWHSIMPGKIFDVAYEDVVADSRGKGQELLEYLGLDWEEACANFEQNTAAVVTASAAQVRDKVHSKSVGRWKQYETQLAPTLEILKAADLIGDV